jgi:hypothetical protein
MRIDWYIGKTVKQESRKSINQSLDNQKRRDAGKWDKNCGGILGYPLLLAAAGFFLVSFF